MAIALAAGCSHVINYRSDNFAHRVIELTVTSASKSYSIALGKDTFAGSAAVPRQAGTLFVFGQASGNPPLINLFDLAPRMLNLTSPVLLVYVATP